MCAKCKYKILSKEEKWLYFVKNLMVDIFPLILVPDVFQLIGYRLSAEFERLSIIYFWCCFLFRLFVFFAENGRNESDITWIFIVRTMTLLFVLAVACTMHTYSHYRGVWMTRHRTIQSFGRVAQTPNASEKFEQCLWWLSPRCIKCLFICI